MLFGVPGRQTYWITVGDRWLWQLPAGTSIGRPTDPLVSVSPVIADSGQPILKEIPRSLERSED